MTQDTQGTSAAPHPPDVRHPVMFHHWRQLTFLHWRYPAEAVARLLPPGLEVETFDGTAWVGLIPFLMDGVRAPGLPAVPWLSRFPETNVRTYVRGPDGNTGIWFFSLDAARLPAVLAARAGYGLPYYWSDMTVTSTDTTTAYGSRRRWPDGAYCAAMVRLGGPVDPGPRDHFLTARYRLYSRIAGRLVTAEAAHGPWPLRHAEVTHLRQNLVRAAGLPEPDRDPLVHASPGVSVRIGMWRPV